MEKSPTREPKQAKEKLPPFEAKLQQFNSLIERIEKQKLAYSVHLDWGERLLELAGQRLVPLFEKYFVTQGELVVAVDQRLAGENLDEDDHDLVRDFIFNTLLEAFQYIPIPESWKAIFEKWEKQSIEEAQTQKAKEQRAFTVDFLSALSGIKVDLDEQNSNPESRENVAQALEERKARLFGMDNLTKSQLRTEKMRIARKQAVAERKSHTLRSLYAPTAKALNPDAETDPVLKAEKLEALKAVEAAYTAKDVVALLAFEKKWLGGRKRNPANPSLKQITDLIEILLDQTKTLERKKWELDEDSRYRLIKPFWARSEKTSIKGMEKVMEEWQSAIEEAQADLVKVRKMKSVQSLIRFLEELMDDEGDYYW